MDAASIVREELRHSHDWLEQTVEGVTAEQLHWLPPGTANPIGATYVHVVIDEDELVNAEARGGERLCDGEWAGRIGLSEPQVSGPGWDGWARRVRVDLELFRGYARAVQTESDRWAAALIDGDLAHAVEFGGRPPPISRVLLSVVSHNHGHAGEIAVLKGLQGGRGFTL
ncbi:MAG: DinB family protein [Dehalococcoidia bacterium]|nr:DinB family protein [Dehalococcoidia bacterium]